MAITKKNGKNYVVSGPDKSNGNYWNHSTIKYTNFDNYGKKIKLGISPVEPIPVKIEDPKPIIEQPEIKNPEKEVKRINKSDPFDGYLEDDMPIYRKDGSNFTAMGTLQTYPKKTADIELMDKMDQEQIELGGSIIFYYPCYIDTNYDKLYNEDIDSIWAQQGYMLYSSFAPVRPTQVLSQFGIDSPDELFFNFNISKWKEIVTEMPKVKSLIYSEWDKTLWQIIQPDQEAPYKLWNKYRLQVHCKKYQPSRGDKLPTFHDQNNPSTVGIY